MKIPVLVATGIFLLSPPIALRAANAPSPSAKPNIIVILADDMGYSDLSCYGSEIPTPNLDALAKDGLRFTQFYNTSRCCPSRAAILTGLYSHEAGIGRMTEQTALPGYLGHLNDNCVTFAQVLHSAGYFTIQTGKWHVGMKFGDAPVDRGFDRSLAAPAGGFYYPEGKKGRLVLNGVHIPDNDPRLPPNWYSTDLWTGQGIKFIDEAVSAKKPFFYYLPFNAPHFPLQAPAEDIAKFRHGIYMQGWDKLRGTNGSRPWA
jgi:arylsulfatase A-like enzyme